MHFGSDKGKIYGKFKNKNLNYIVNKNIDDSKCEKDKIDEIYRNAFKDGIDTFVSVSNFKLNKDFLTKINIDNFSYDNDIKTVKYKKRKYNDLFRSIDGKKICPSDKIADVFCKGFKDGAKSIFDIINQEIGIDVNNGKYDYKCKILKYNDHKLSTEITYGVINNGR